MLKHSTRRWFAGIGVAGALIAASATPASAEESGDEVFLFANSVLLAPGGDPKSVTLHAFTEALPEDLTVTVDKSTVKDFADVTLTDTLAGCTDTASTITCKFKGADVIDYLLDLTVEAKDSAAAGDKGDLTFTLATEGEKSVSTTATVEIGEGIDLKAQESFAFSGAPGTSAKAPLGVTNVGKTVARDAVLFFAMTPGLVPAQRHSNCSYLFAFGTQFAQCGIGEIAPGAVLQLGASSALKIADDAWAPGEQYGAAVWFGSGDWAEFLAEFPVPAEDWEKGSGSALELVPAVTATARGLKQIDTDPSNNATEIHVTVKGKQGADAAATGAMVDGSVGKTVTAKVGFVNNGPAMINAYMPGELTTAAEVTIPAGATVVGAPEQCAPVKGEDIGEFGEPGGRVYFCEWFDLLRKGDAAVLEFGLRIDKLSGAAGAVKLLHFDLGDDDRTTVDLNPKNDVAPFALKGASGNGGGSGDGDDPTLPITGDSTTLVTVVGGLLLIAGAAGYVVARRRRTRFVA
ncbi:LPXTG cell wall anchor domain-containing protein [Micromonospora sp. H33]|uniref:LPXTG cell wall anchor domain-containing protein n=1 Tax=Micromonospora sp. H33 TaxID=3452215 RepID=UPI003F8C4C39